MTIETWYWEGKYERYLCMFPDIEGSSQKMLLLNERNRLCKGLFIINNLRPSSRDLVPKCCIDSAPKGNSKCCEVAFQRNKEGRFVKVNLEIATDNLISQRLITIQLAYSEEHVAGGQRFWWCTGKSLVFLSWSLVIVLKFCWDLERCVMTWWAACSDNYGLWRRLRMPTSWMDSTNLGSWEKMADVMIGSDFFHDGLFVQPQWWIDQNHHERHLIERDSGIVV